MQWNGTVWTPQTSGTAEYLLGAWGADANNVWAVGVGGAMAKWNGTAWTAQNGGTTLQLNGVWGTDAKNVWTVGVSGTILRYQPDP